MHFKEAFIVVIAIVAVLGLTFGIGRMVSAFTEPSQAPPEGNTPAPINVGSEPQTKSGSINAISGLFDGGVKVCRTDGANCPGSLTGRPTVLRYANPPSGAVLGPADICMLESFDANKENERCLLYKNGDLYLVSKARVDSCTWVCLRW